MQPKFKVIKICPGTVLPSAELGTHLMGLDQLQMALLVQDDSLLRLFTAQGKVFVMQHETFFIRDK